VSGAPQDPRPADLRADDPRPDDPRPDDVVRAAAVLQLLATRSDEDHRWERPAAPTRWSAARSLGHIADALVLYGSLVATRATGQRQPARDGRSAPPSGQLADVEGAAAVLAATLRDLGDEVAWHPAGVADAAGWAGMAVTEVLVHGVDVGRALEVVGLELPEDVCERAVRRVFPWAAPSLEHHGAARVFLAVTGREDVEGIAHDPQWWWQAAPLPQWDGRPRQRTRPPQWA